MKSNQFLKPGEKILFAVFAAFFALAIVGYIVLETVRSRSVEPMFVSRASFDLSPEGKQGSLVFRESGCAACHRALRSGTNNGLSLDGVGSYRTQAWIKNFLTHPEDTYSKRTVDHGFGKEAGYVELMPPKDLHLLTIFLSQLQADEGSSLAKIPPPESSGFIDSMVNMWAPESWKSEYQDIRVKQRQESDISKESPSS